MLVVSIAAGLPAAQGASTTPAATIWELNNLRRVGGHAVEVVGSPRIVQDEQGSATLFDGVDDGLIVEANPLKGLDRFTVEVVFAPAADGAGEQRFLHMEESAGSGNRALVELRMGPDRRWALDTYLKHGDANLTLLDRNVVHTSSEWHTAAITFDGGTMTHYVDGRAEGSGPVAFRPLGEGRTSIGMRQNRVSFFKGRVRLVRVTAAVLVPADFLRAGPAVIPLWPEGVPAARRGGGDERLVDGRVYNVQTPTLSHYAAESTAPATGTAVIVCPGGGYERLAMANEAAGAVRALTPLGVSVFVLKYRLKEYGYPAPLQDVLRAVRMVQSRAAELGVRADRVGLFGASAGGHLAAMAATLFDAPEGRTGAGLDATSARPDFVALLYPVITMREPYGHAASRRNLLGEAPDAPTIERMSMETAVRRDMPPVFLVHTAEDATVPIENSLDFAAALRRAGVPVEAHFYERGAHGFGFTEGLGSTSDWVGRWIDWMSAHAWI